MFAPPRRRSARAVPPAGAASAASAAVWRRYPKRDSKGRIEWIHWADLDLATAWAEQALRELDAFVAKYSGPTASASQLEGGARAPINTDAFAVLRSLNNAFQALNVPPIVPLESEEFGTVHLLRSFVAIRDGRIEVRTSAMIGAARPNGSQNDLATLWRRLGQRDLAHDESVVVDVRTRAVVLRGSFEAGLQHKRAAPNQDRPYLAMWARKPWTLDRGDDVEFVWSEPSAWERDRTVRKLQLARPMAESIARDPWTALVAGRTRVKANNDSLASEWGRQLPELSTASSAASVETVQRTLDMIAQARSEHALNEARARAREGLATGAGSAIGVLGLLSAAAPPAALVLAPVGAVLGAVSALAGLLLQVIPRNWLATAESTPPRLPLPRMISGDEAATAVPAIDVLAPPAFSRRPETVRGPTPLDPLPTTAVDMRSETVLVHQTSTAASSVHAHVPTNAKRALLPLPANTQRRPTFGTDTPVDATDAAIARIRQGNEATMTAKTALVALGVTASLVLLSVAARGRTRT